MNAPRKITKAIIPVAGLGTRFLPATKAQPKEMLSIVDKPVIQFLVEEAVDSGIEEIIFVTGKGKRAIEDHFDHAPELDAALRKKGKHDVADSLKKISELAKFSYVRQSEPKGDGDAILTAMHLIGDEPVAILFGDDLIWNDERPALRQMMDVYEKYDAPVVALEQVPESEVHHYGVIKPKKEGERLYRVEALVEKPEKEDAPSNLAIIGKYIITPDVLRELEKVTVKEGEELRLAHALDATARKRAVYGLEPIGERLDCGSKIGFLKATVRFGLSHDETKEEFKKFLATLK
ncbi:MAG: UTP--glucose-1-phosphate uridylyltransferase [Candidatus Taylorbacteria bacterium CG11_big_fil_rev_8_21_14_0_20_46_11]|uniref:UTP--glucose-1-phosphate uridylyltransferase n=1 Tax=Candidatus Taylorbacteria bacterium CG11_big_fil_rev_8_21_14_0_20_46_11 TaxID=1975025 RepID=A0A2H0KEQ4_9BACT|nr:MAG: UTP--glucose-1-phosphate uridylyltransferase [Candidatus Taylorbacteria bacterium CG11_big_fil_rev_8_21_14_0_20_46_11]